MPVNFLQLRRQIQQMGEQARDHLQRQRRLLEQALELLRLYAEQNSLLQQRVSRVVQVSPRLRCAVPGDEALTLGKTCPPQHSPLTVIAADGSQVNPSRHDPFPVCVINIGAILLPGGHPTPSVPQEFTHTRLFYHDEVLTSQGLLSEGLVALRRDLYERQFLAGLTAAQPTPVVALTDGPLELFPEAHERESSEFRAAMQEYIESLHRLEEQNVVAAGYVDRPLADLVVRLLELVLLAEDEFAQAGRRRPLLGVRDEQLFASFLSPGTRSAVFSIQSQQAQHFTDSLALHFFYLNSGRPGHPAMARVEIPAWVAGNAGLLDLLHRALLEQCAQMGTHPYPYALQRAHEIALIGLDEKDRILEMINLEQLRHGLPAGEVSHKQAGKNLLTTRTRYP